MDVYNHPSRVCMWIRENSESFYAMVDICKDLMRHGKARIRRGEVFSRVEDLELPAPRCNGWWATLSRYIVMIEPELSRSIHFQKSFTDEIDLKALWLEYLDHDPFKVSNRKEAQKLWHVS